MPAWRSPKKRKSVHFRAQKNKSAEARTGAIGGGFFPASPGTRFRSPTREGMAQGKAQAEAAEARALAIYNETVHDQRLF